MIISLLVSGSDFVLYIETVVMKNHKFATIFVTLYLVIFTVLTQLYVPLWLIGLMYCLSPFLVIWLVITVLKYATYNGKQLAEDEIL